MHAVRMVSEAYRDKLSKFSVLHKSSNWPDIVLDVNYAIVVYNYKNLVVLRTYQSHIQLNMRVRSLPHAV